MSNLSEWCGHHCGIVAIGKVIHSGHCNCLECHGGQWPVEVTSLGRVVHTDVVSAYPVTVMERSAHQGREKE